MPDSITPMTGAELTDEVLTQDVGNGWRYIDLLATGLQIAMQLSPADAQSTADELTNRVLHNAFVKAGILRYMENSPQNIGVEPLAEGTTP
jgi:hypothetical protein